MSALGKGPLEFRACGPSLITSLLDSLTALTFQFKFVTDAFSVTVMRDFAGRGGPLQFILSSSRRVIASESSASIVT